MRRILVILLLVFGTATAAFDIREERTLTLTEKKSEWVSTSQQTAYARCWTVTFLPGQCGSDADSGCTPGTAPTTCVAQVEGCSENDSADCTDPDDIIVTSSTVADCTSKTAVFHDENFRWLRVNATTFTGTGATMRLVFFGTP